MSDQDEGDLMDPISAFHPVEIVSEVRDLVESGVCDFEVEELLTRVIFAMLTLNALVSYRGFKASESELTEDVAEDLRNMQTKGSG